MPKTPQKRGEARKAVGKSTPTRARRKKAPDEDAFTRSLVVHGQAAKAGPDGKLPPGATHELVEDDQGQVKAVRRRFSAL